MPLSIVCLMDGKEITITRALGFDAEQRRNLTCIECGKRVTPHKKSHDGSQEAHFEHHRRNKQCSRSDHRTD